LSDGREKEKQWPWRPEPQRLLTRPSWWSEVESKRLEMACLPNGRYVCRSQV
jgi:hypothetical protein